MFDARLWSNKRTTSTSRKCQVGVPQNSSQATPDSSTTSACEPVLERAKTLLDELADALIGAVAVYGMADVRSMLRADRLTASAGGEDTTVSSLCVPQGGDPELLDKALRLPITRGEMMQLLQANVDALHQAKIPADLYLSLLDGLCNYSVEDNTTSSPSDINENSSGRWLYTLLRTNMFFSPTKEGIGTGTVVNSIDSSVFLTVFDDENSSKELVYYIAVDKERRLIKVVFRGSVTVGDWMADVDSRMVTVPNPLLAGICEVKSTTTQSKTVSIHQGFYSYLFGTSKTSPVSKYQTIVEHLQRLLSKYEGYGIRASGHSLGGALSTLFAFHAACDGTLPKPILCVSFASPRIGNLEFARAHQECEVLGRLRSIRVANDRDIVTMVPDRLAYAVAMTNSIYRHVGIEVRLFQAASTKRGDGAHLAPIIHFPTCHPQVMKHLVDDVNAAVWNWFTRPVNLINAWRQDYARFHSCKEYSDRLARAREHLSSMTLDELVNDYLRHCS